MRADVLLGSVCLLPPFEQDAAARHLLTTSTLTFNEQRRCESVWGLVAYSGASTQTLVHYFISLFLEEFLSLKINTDIPNIPVSARSSCQQPK